MPCTVADQYFKALKKATICIFPSTRNMKSHGPDLESKFGSTSQALSGQVLQMRAEACSDLSAMPVCRLLFQGSVL